MHSKKITSDEHRYGAIVGALTCRHWADEPCCILSVSTAERAVIHLQIKSGTVRDVIFHAVLFLNVIGI